jgi:hypothetical protein
MLKKTAKRLILALALSAGLLSVALPLVYASDFSCVQIQGTDNIFCSSSTSSAGFYYFYYNTVTGDYFIGP